MKWLWTLSVVLAVIALSVFDLNPHAARGAVERVSGMPWADIPSTGTPSTGTPTTGTTEARDARRPLGASDLHVRRGSTDDDQMRGGPRHGTVRQLRRANGWVRALAVYRRLPCRGIASLKVAFADATDPVVRQNLIFLAVIFLPREESHAWLRSLFGPGDYEDAQTALYFDGAEADFGRTVSRADVHRLVDTIKEHEALGREGTAEARAILRSYRAIEVLDHRPYFKLTPIASGLDWPEREHDPAVKRRLIEAWLTVYPGHPGSDDMAMRRGRLEPDPYRAAVWASRAAVLPDQDVTDGAIRDLLELANEKLTLEQLHRLAYEQEGNRTLLSYVRLRRFATTFGFEVAVREAEEFARDAPDSTIGRAWHGALTPRAETIDAYSYIRPPGNQERLDPPREPLGLDVKRLARQLAQWHKVVSLERELRTANRARRAQLLYDLAAMHYHDRDLVWPVFLRHGLNASSMAPRDAFAVVRALELFDLLEREHPDYPRLDKVVFSKAMLLKRLLDHKPAPRDGPDVTFKSVAEAFQDCAVRFPDSTLADDAARAAAYWRSRR